MAQRCDVCGKEPWVGYTVSHSHKRNKHRWNPNIQKIRAVVDGRVKRINACTACIKAGKVVKPTR